MKTKTSRPLNTKRISPRCQLNISDHLEENAMIKYITETPLNLSAIAMANEIAVTFVEGNSIYKIIGGHKKFIKEIEPLVKISCNSFKIRP